VEVELVDISIYRHIAIDGVLCLAVAGEVDIATSGQLDAAISESIDAGNVTQLLVDLDQVTFLDSTGIRVLLDGRDRATKHAIAFRITNPQGVVRRSLEITGLLAILTNEC
jgi:anti-sigma B factor antagonist